MADSSDTDSERLPATRTNGRTRTISRLPARLVVVTRMTWRWLLGFAGGRQPVALAQCWRRDRRVLPTTPRNATSDPLRHGREIGLAVERCENGAAHEGSAAKTGQDRPAEPLHRDAAAIDQLACLAVDGKRRLVAEIDLLGIEVQSICVRAVCRDPRPTSPPLATVASGLPQHTLQGAKRGRRRRAPKVRSRQRSRGRCGPSRTGAQSSFADVG